MRGKGPFASTLMTFPNRLELLLLSAYLGLFVCNARAQADTGVRNGTPNGYAARAETPEFEVVSIKPGVPGIANWSILLLQNGDE